MGNWIWLVCSGITDKVDMKTTKLSVTLRRRLRVFPFPFFFSFFFSFSREDFLKISTWDWISTQKKKILYLKWSCFHYTQFTCLIEILFLESVLESVWLIQVRKKFMKLWYTRLEIREKLRFSNYFLYFFKNEYSILISIPFFWNMKIHFNFGKL